MKTKSSSLTIRVPHELKEKITLVAEHQGISVNQLAMYLFTKEITRIILSSEEDQWKKLKSDYLSNKTEEEIVLGFEKVLNKIKSYHGKNNIELPDWDKI